jgi:hypothetical protein
VLHKHLAPAFEPIVVKSNWLPNERKQDIVEQGLKSRNTVAIVRKELGKGVGTGDAQRQNLAELVSITEN